MTSRERSTEYDSVLSAANMVNQEDGRAVVTTLAQADGWETFDGIARLANWVVPRQLDQAMIRATLTALVEVGAAEHRTATDAWRMKPAAYRAWLTAPWRQNRARPLPLPPGVTWDQVRVVKRAYSLCPWRLVVMIDGKIWEVGSARAFGFARKADALAVLDDLRTQALAGCTVVR